MHKNSAISVYSSQKTNNLIKSDAPNILIFENNVEFDLSLDNLKNMISDLNISI